MGEKGFMSFWLICFLRSFAGRATGSAQDDKEGFPLKTLSSFRLTRRTDRDKKTPQTNII